MALCSLSTGSSSAPPSRTASIKILPALTSASLFASNNRFPARAAASAADRPAKPTIAAITVSTSRIQPALSSVLHRRELLYRRHLRAGAQAQQQIGIKHHRMHRFVFSAEGNHCLDRSVRGQRIGAILLRMAGNNIQRIKPIEPVAPSTKIFCIRRIRPESTREQKTAPRRRCCRDGQEVRHARAVASPSPYIHSRA